MINLSRCRQERRGLGDPADPGRSPEDPAPGRLESLQERPVRGRGHQPDAHLHQAPAQHRDHRGVQHSPRVPTRPCRRPHHDHRMDGQRKAPRSG